MRYRYTPFGYQIVNGEIVPHPAESLAVQEIFRLYDSGKGYTVITNRMNDSGVDYHPNQPWNKHMVKRILENMRYTGQRSYPQIIEPELFASVRERQLRKPKHTEKPHATLLLSVCEERSYHYAPSATVRRLTNDINRALERVAEPSAVKTLVYQCVHEKYNSIGGSLE